MENRLNAQTRNFSFLDQQKTEVSSAKRFCAYLIDWFLSSLAALLPICLLWTASGQPTETMTQATVFALAEQTSDQAALMAGCIGLVLSLAYMVLIPWKITPGQTPGKRIMNLRIVSKDGSPLTLTQLCLRQIIGLICLEGLLYTGSSLAQDLLSLSTGLNFTGILMYVSVIGTAISFLIAMAAGSRRMLHDYLSRTTITEAVCDRPDQQI